MKLRFASSNPRAFAILMRQMMEGVVLRGTGRVHARLNGYTSAGKTGTAQIFDTATHHYTHNYNASFVGFAPVTNPALVVLVTVHNTSGEERTGARMQPRRCSAPS